MDRDSKTDFSLASVHTRPKKSKSESRSTFRFFSVECAHVQAVTPSTKLKCHPLTVRRRTMWRINSWLWEAGCLSSRTELWAILIDFLFSTASTHTARQIIALFPKNFWIAIQKSKRESCCFVLVGTHLMYDTWLRQMGLHFACKPGYSSSGVTQSRCSFFNSNHTTNGKTDRDRTFKLYSFWLAAPIPA